MDIIEQIFLDWNLDTVEKFEFQVDNLINKLKTKPKLCPKSIFENLHKCVINKHNSLIYRFMDNNKIEIVLLIYNKSDHIFSNY